MVTQDLQGFSVRLLKFQRLRASAVEDLTTISSLHGPLGGGREMVSLVTLGMLQTAQPDHASICGSEDFMWTK